MFGEQLLQVRQMLITHVQLAAAGKDVDQCVVEDQLHRFSKFQVLHIAYESCPGAGVEDLETSIRYLVSDAEPGVPKWIVFGTIAMHYMYQITNFKRWLNLCRALCIAQSCQYCVTACDTKSELHLC